MLMKAPEDAVNVGFDGEVFAVENGVVDVPAKAVKFLLSHGYELFEEVKVEVEKVVDEIEAEVEQFAGKTLTLPKKGGK